MVILKSLFTNDIGLIMGRYEIRVRVRVRVRVTWDVNERDGVKIVCIHLTCARFF